jgi:hypothetical protein
MRTIKQSDWPGVLSIPLKINGILRSGKQLFRQIKHLCNSVPYEEREGFRGNLISNITNTLLLRDGKVSRNSYSGVLSYMTRKALIIYG